MIATKSFRPKCSWKSTGNPFTLKNGHSPVDFAQKVSNLNSYYANMNGFTPESALTSVRTVPSALDKMYAIGLLNLFKSDN